MQLLLGEQVNITDSSLLQELFLQWLPSNVQMILASADDMMVIDKLAEMADRIMDVLHPPFLLSVHPQKAANSEE